MLEIAQTLSSQIYFFNVISVNIYKSTYNLFFKELRTCQFFSPSVVFRISLLDQKGPKQKRLSTRTRTSNVFNRPLFPKRFYHIQLFSPLFFVSEGGNDEIRPRFIPNSPLLFCFFYACFFDPPYWVRRKFVRRL